jgi:hypothetical protein
MEIIPRKARLDAPGALHHIFVRGIEYRKIFFDDEDRDNFLERLGTVLTDTGTACANRYGDATVINRICGQLQSAPPPAWSTFPESL